ncbi:helix-turn-helix domain-containing protein [Saccharothrix sp. HUAS TT1]|uniref:helix-turn-helix domain-containing protein n=1 Tax=unclassified Saccharothrix TaxID=2593673 RepID=UPI00345C4932
MDNGSVEVLTADEAAPGQRLDLWRRQVQLTCGALQVGGNRDEFANGTITTGRFGKMQVSLIAADPHIVSRSDRVTGSPEDGWLYVCRIESGRAYLRQDDKEAVSVAGDVMCFDSLRAYTLAMPEPFEMVALRFPHQAIGLKPGRTRCLTTEPWSGARGVGALVGQLLHSLGANLGELDAAAVEPLGSTISSLINTLFAERLRTSGNDPLIARQVLMMRVQAFAREQLADPDLTPASLAKRHNISLRYLQQLFAELDTSPARWIREERLTRCHAALRNPAYDHLTVAAIGERWGLPGPSHISRLFRDQYGLTPREFRKQWQLDHGTATTTQPELGNVS